MLKEQSSLILVKEVIPFYSDRNAKIPSTGQMTSVRELFLGSIFLLNSVHFNMSDIWFVHWDLAVAPGWEPLE